MLGDSARGCFGCGAKLHERARALDIADIRAVGPDWRITPIGWTAPARTPAPSDGTAA
ncbi:MAG: hypothetical protein R3F37_09430 [Candidatus Competibacteraceae bacterium]